MRKSIDNQENIIPPPVMIVNEEKEQKKAEYNQRLLKSLERKTLRESVASLQQPLLSKYR